MSILSVPHDTRSRRSRGRAISLGALGAACLVALPVVFVAGDADAKRRGAGFRTRGAHRQHSHHGYVRRPHLRRPYAYRPYFYPTYYGYPYDAFYSYRLVPAGPFAVTAAEIQGWVYLDRSDPKRALSVFARSARRDESDATAQLGYSVASIQIGDVDRGVWAMRRAALTDASAFERVPLSETGRERLLYLAESLHDPDVGVSEADAHFAIAGLLLAAGEVSAASAALEAAGELGDQSESALALGSAIAAAEAAPAES